VTASRTDQGAGRPHLVLLHGWGMHPGVWGPFRAALDAHFSVHTPALPGHGDAPERPGWSPGDLAADWLAAHPGAYWLGWSLGAQVALAAAALEPARVRGLLLLGATPRFVQDPGWPCAMPADDFRAFRAQCRRDPARALDRFLGLVARGGDDERGALRALRRRLGAAPRPARIALLEGLRVLEETDLRARLPALRAPTLWVTGEGDALTPPAAARQAARNQDGARVSFLPGAGHAPFLTHPNELLTMTRQWFLAPTP